MAMNYQLTDYLAVYASILSTIILVKDLYVFFTDRPSLQLKVFEGYVGTSKVPINGMYSYSVIETKDFQNQANPSDKLNYSECCVIANVSNSSKRPVRIVLCGFRVKGGGSLTVNAKTIYDPSSEMGEGGYNIFYFSKDNLLEQIKQKNKILDYFFVKTSTGKVFKDKNIRSISAAITSP